MHRSNFPFLNGVGVRGSRGGYVFGCFFFVLFLNIFPLPYLPPGRRSGVRSEVSVYFFQGGVGVGMDGGGGVGVCILDSFFCHMGV